MREVIDDILYNDDSAYLLVADLGKFTKMSTTDRYIDVGLSETLMVNTAIGLLLSGKRVYLYSVAGFTLYRAWEQIKLGLVSYGDMNWSCTLLNGGAGFVYNQCGIGHYLMDDMLMVHTLLPNVRILLPHDRNTTVEALQHRTGLTYVRLCSDHQESYRTVMNNSTPLIVTMGWLVPEVSEICNQLCLRFSPLIDVRSLPIEPYAIIYDNVHCKFLENEYCISSKYIDRSDNITDDDIEIVRDKYGFSHEKLYSYILEMCK